jgi:hypothetical protein
MTMSDTLAERLRASVLDVTKDWAKQRKAEERHASAEINRRARLIPKPEYYNFKSAAFEVMEEAYLKASANGTLPAAARQVMYQARPFIQDKMGGQPLNDQYFCQQLLPDYMEEYGVDWDIVYDERGHFFEPHIERSFGLGTISVRDYLANVKPPKIEEPGFAAGQVKTHGPGSCFGAVLFIEKEGFLPLFSKARLAERYDLAIMSTKGMSSTAARSLIDNLCRKQVPLLALHDFDKAGLSIAGTLKRSTRRFSFEHNASIIDLGLRLADVRDLGLETSAEDAFDRGGDFAKRRNLQLNGATDDEVEFLLNQRVELNALTSDQLVGFIERKLAEHGIRKVIPQADLLGEAYRLFVNSARLEKIVEEAIEDIEDQDDLDAPVDLRERVAEYLQRHPESRWDAAVAAIADEIGPDERVGE